MYTVFVHVVKTMLLNEEALLVLEIFWLLLLKIYLPERKSKYFILQTND